MTYKLIAALLLALLNTHIVVADVTLDSVWKLLADGRCSQARQQIQNSEHPEQFLASPQGESLYAKSLCCSPVSELTTADLDNAGPDGQEGTADDIGNESK